MQTNCTNKQKSTDDIQNKAEIFKILNQLSERNIYI